MSGRNVVPMPRPNTTTVAPPPPVINPQWWGGGCGAGCAPGCGCGAGDMGSLIGCYYQVQAAQTFIGSIMVDQINTNPAVIQAIISEIGEAKTPVALTGVTDGSTAQPGQVGEYFEVAAPMAFVATGGTSAQLTLGVLQPGDWDCWMWATFAGPGNTPIAIGGASFFLSPVPAGAAADLSAALYGSGAPVGIILSTMATQIITAVPVLIGAQANVTASGTAGTMTVLFAARRRR